MGGLGGNGLGIGLGLTLGTGVGVSLTLGVVPLESVLTPLAGTGLFLATGPALRALHPTADADIVIVAAKQSHKADLFMG